MTTARQRDHGPRDPRDLIICERVDDDIRRINRERRRAGKHKLGQSQIAFEVFGRNQAWLSKRLLGEIPFTAAELMSLGDYLGVDILVWLNAAKSGPDDTDGVRQSTDGYMTPLLTLMSDESVQTTPPIGVLESVA